VSLLDRGSEDVTVFLEESVTDADGNIKTRPSATGITTTASVQLIGTPAESQDTGYQTGSRYRLRFPRSWPHTLGAQSQIEWNGQRWSLDGDASLHNSSRRTAHATYVIIRK
jgi:hypothetical protein